MSAIAEFLLARYAEDEYEAKVCLDQYTRGDGGSTRRWRRVLAECEAKRRVVAVCVEDLESRGDGALDGKVDRATWDVLVALTLPYADHPDCQQEWKP